MDLDTGQRDLGNTNYLDQFLHSTDHRCFVNERPFKNSQNLNSSILSHCTLIRMTGFIFLTTVFFANSKDRSNFFNISNVSIQRGTHYKYGCVSRFQKFQRTPRLCMKRNI